MTLPNRPPVVLPRVEVPPPVPPVMMIGLGFVLAPVGWLMAFFGLYGFRALLPFALVALVCAGAAFTRGFGTRLSTGWRGSWAALLVVAVGVFLIVEFNSL